MKLVCMGCQTRVKIFEFAGKKYIEECTCKKEKVKKPKKEKVIKTRATQWASFNVLGGMKVGNYVIRSILSGKSLFEMLSTISKRQTRKSVEKYYFHTQKRILDGTLFDFMKANSSLSVEEMFEELSKIGQVRSENEIKALIRSFKEEYVEKVSI